MMAHKKMCLGERWLRHLLYLLRRACSAAPEHSKSSQDIHHSTRRSNGNLSRPSRLDLPAATIVATPQRSHCEPLKHEAKFLRCEAWKLNKLPLQHNRNPTSNPEAMETREILKI